MSNELLTALNAEAISRMSPYELADRAVALRMGEHNALGVKPIETEDGKTFYTVTSGLVAPDYCLGTAVETQEGEVVRRQTTEGPFTLFADVVELQMPAQRRKGQARLFRIEAPMDPVLANATGPFREIVDGAIEATGAEVHRRGVSLDGGFVYLRRWGDQPNPDETFYGHYPGSSQELVATGETKLITKLVGGNKLNKEIGVRISFQGLVRAALDKGFITRVTNDKVLMGPTYDKNVEFRVPAREPQSDRYSIIPEGAEVIIENGQVTLRGPRADQDGYKYAAIQPKLSNARIRDLASDKALGVEDVTEAVLRGLGGPIATALPLDAAAAYAQTVAKAREEARLTILGGLSPVPGGIGCLAVAARMAELPDHPEGYVADREYFLRVV